VAKITERKGYYTLAWTEPDTGQRRRVSIGKVGTIPKRELDDILRIKEYEISAGARLLNAHRRPAPTFGQFVAKYKLWHQAEYPDSTYRTAQIIDDHLLPEFGATPMNLITVDQAEQWKTKRRFKVEPQTVEKELRVLFAVINRAIALKLLAENPIAAVKPPKILKSKPHHWYRAPELALLYQQSSYGPVWKFLANTGLRRGESLHLRRVWITDDSVRIQSTGEERTKSGEWRRVPLSDGAREALGLIPERGPYLLPRIARESLSRAFARDAKSAGLEGSLHSLRHTFICHLLLQGETMRTVQLYAGHAHQSTTEKYAYQVLDMHSDRALRLNI
jgi:integrase